METKCKCNNCSQPVDCCIGQSAVRDELEWSYSYACPHCGEVVEYDDTGFPPESIRKQILHSEGEWQLTVIGLDAQRTRVMQSLRNILQLGLQEVSSMTAASSGIVYSGTKTETEWLHALMERDGIQSNICPSTP